MVELTKYIVEQLVDDKSAIDITSSVDEAGVETISIRVAEGDIGKVIGKQGKIAMSIRTLAKAVGIREGKKIQHRNSGLTSIYFLPQICVCGNLFIGRFGWRGTSETIDNIDNINVSVQRSQRK